jgi:hypothetical protein
MLYHGTATMFSTFSEASIGIGSDANSALGVHFSECPIHAASTIVDRLGHAIPGSFVLIARVWIDRALISQSGDEFLIGPSWTDPTTPVEVRRRQFAAARQRLLADGFDAVCTDGCYDGDAGSWCILNPRRIAIIGRIPADNVLDVEPSRELHGIEFAVGDIFGTNEARLALL